MCKVLVTGGAGFIGSSIVDLLVSNGYSVVILDDLSNGDIKNVNKAAVFYNQDIKDSKLYEIFDTEKPEYVIHAAAQINVERSMQDPVFDANVNIIGSLNVLECCYKVKVRKIVYSSSAAVYGNPVYLGIDETHDINPVSFYGMSKYITEQYIKLYSNLYGLKYSILRYSNVYGIRQSFKGEGGAVSSFIINMLKGQNPVIYGSGQQTRDFIYVEDVARANMLSLQRGDNDIFNIGTGVDISINDLLKSLAELIGDCIPLYMPEKKGDIVNSYFNITKSAEVLGWKPEYSFIDGLKKTIQWYSMQNM